MQKAFNKTIIKLQNTSRIAEEQVSNQEAQTTVQREERFYQEFLICQCFVLFFFPHTGPAPD